MGNITIIGGTPASSGNTGGSSSLAIGQTVQAVGGPGLLPLDGQIYTKAAYPELHAQLNAGIPLIGVSGVLTGSTAALNVAAQPVVSAYSDALKMHVAFTIGATTNVIVVSKDDGYNWQPVSIPGPMVTMLNVVSDGTKFVIMTTTNTIVSTDGFTWTNATPLPITITSVATMNVIGTKFSASVASSTLTGVVNLYLASNDGTSWTIRGLPMFSVTKIIKAGSKYLAIGSVSSNQIGMSLDGFVWTMVTLPDTDIMLSIAATADRVCIVGVNKIFTSIDGGTTWTSKASTYGAISVLTSFVASDTLFVLSATFAGVGSVYKSVDGDTWTKLNTGVNVGANTITYTGSKYVMPINGANAVLVSTDLIDWSAKTLPISSDWGLCIWTGSKLVLIPNTGTTSLMSSDNGETWVVASTTVPPAATSRLRWAANATNTRFVMTSSGSSSTIFSSVDAITWTTQTLPSAGVWAYIAAKDSTFVVCTSTAAASSTDGTTWVARTNAAPGEVISNGTTFVSAQISGSVQATPFATSTDGITWTGRTAGTSLAIASFSYNGSVFMAILSGSAGTVYTSADGITWVNKGASPTLAGYTIVANYAFSGFNVAVTLMTLGNNQFMAVNTADATGLNWNLRPMPMRQGQVWRTSFGATKTTIIGVGGALLLKYSDVAGDFVASTLPTPKDGLGYTSYTPFASSGTTLVAATSGITANGLPFAIISSDNGTTWSTVKTPVTATGVQYINGKVVLTDASNVYTTNDNTVWVANKAALTNAGGDASIAFWFYNSATQNQMIMYTTDGATLLGNAPRGIKVAIATSSTVAIGADTGDISRSIDNGASWTYQLTVALSMNLIAYHPVFDTFYITINNSPTGYYSNDAGLTWTGKPISVSSIARTGMVVYGKMLYVMGDAGDNAYSMNGGATWVENKPISSASFRTLVNGNTTMVAFSKTGYGVYSIKKLFDETTSFQLPVVTTPVGSPAWFVKAK